MRSNLPDGRIDLPSEETCVSFAAKSVSVAEHVRQICGHLPRSLRTTLIESAILHQCWKRQMGMRRRNRQTACDVSKTPIPVLDAVAIAQRRSANVYTVEASDEHLYRVSSPLPGRGRTLATEVLSLESAREIGLPVPPASLIFLNRGMAARAGISRDCRATCLSTEMFCPSGDRLCCLGVREFEHVQIAENGEPKLPLGPKAFRNMVGRMVFDLWVLNAVAEAPAFQNVKGRAEPVFGEFRHCLMDADWPKFVRASSRERVPHAGLAGRIRAYQQLEVWIRCVEEVHLEAILERVVKLPSYWYDNQPLLVSAVVTKLDERRRDLRGIIHHLVKAGCFPGIPKAVQRAAEAPTPARVSGSTHNVREFSSSAGKRRLVC
jgi:hypothetical protein